MTKIKNKEFFKLLFADIVSRFGDSVDAIAYSWIIYEITGSKSIMAFNVGVNFLPTVFLTPFTAYLTNKLPKKMIMCIADILRFCIVITIASLYFSENLTTSTILLATLITSTVEAFRSPCSKTILPLLTNDLRAKKCLVSFSRVFELLGFLMSGILIVRFNILTALLVDALTFLLSCITLLFVKYKDNYTESVEKYHDYLDGLKMSFKEIKHDESMKKAILITALVNMSVFPLTVFQINYVVNFMKLGTTGLIYLKFLLTFGLLLGSFIKIKHTPVLLYSVAIGLSLFSLGIFPFITNETIQTPLILISMFILGFSSGILNSMCININSYAFASLSLISIPITAFVCSFLGLFYKSTSVFVIFGCTIIIISILLRKQLNKIN